METTFVELLPIQKSVNKVVNKRLVLNDIDLPEPIDYVLAMHVEFFEYINAIGTWKWWKQNHELKKEKVLDELADIMAFFLSAQIAFGNKSAKMDEAIGEIIENLEPYQAVDIMQNVSISIHEGEPQPSMALMGIAVSLAIKTVEATWEEIVAAYEHKSEVNIQRQEENY